MPATLHPISQAKNCIFYHYLFSESHEMLYYYLVLTNFSVIEKIQIQNAFSFLKTVRAMP